MHRIDADGFAVGNLFTDGNPLVPTVATAVDSAWLNAVQESLCQAITGAGITLVKGTNTQLLSAINALVAAHASAIKAAGVVTTGGGTATLQTGALNIGTPSISNTNYVRIPFAVARSTNKYTVVANRVITSVQANNIILIAPCNFQTTSFDLSGFDASATHAAVNMSNTSMDISFIVI